MKKLLVALCLLVGMGILNQMSASADCGQDETPCGVIGGNPQCCVSPEICCPQDSNVCCDPNQCSGTKCCYQDAQGAPLKACTGGDYCCYANLPNKQAYYCCDGQCCDSECGDPNRVCHPPAEPASPEVMRERRRQMTPVRPERSVEEKSTRRER